MDYIKDNITFEPLPTQHNFLDRTATVVNNLKILGYAGKAQTKEQKTQWFVECYCGAIFIAIGSNLGNGNTKSCGCLTKERIRTQNLSHQACNTRTYRVWCGMKTRCTNPNNPNYKRYGGRGVTMCDRWLHSFENFLTDMGHCPSNKHSIERRDNNGHYEPDNCYWATRDIQNNNTRTNIFLTYQNKTQTIAQWAKELGVRYQFLQQRIKAGWSIQDAFTLPPQKSRH